MKRIAILASAILLIGGCASMRVEVSGEGQGTVGLAKLGAALHKAQKKALCVNGVASETRRVHISTAPVDRDSWIYRVGTQGGFYKPEPRVQMDAEVKCRE